MRHSNKQFCTMKRPAVLLALALPLAASASVREVAHYNLHNAGGMRDTAGPAAWKSLVPGAPDLIRQGVPKLMSNGPECRRREYDWAIKFEAPDQCYTCGQNLVQGDNFVVEVWAYALRGEDGGWHTVVANGHGGIGFLIAQHDRHWAVLVGGVGSVNLGEVEPATWTHLAVVKSDGQVSGWLNGRKMAPLPELGGGAPNFAIGATAPGRESFRGWIAEVRYSTFQAGQFDATEDFLLDNQKLKAVQAAHLAERAKLVESLLATPGVRKVSKFDEHPATADWLIHPPTTPATVQVLPGEKNRSAQILLGNGLISRTFLVADATLTAPSAATISYRNLRSGAEFIRSARPEALLTVNGREIKVGGFLGQPVQNYFDGAWIETMNGDPAAMGFVGCETGEVTRDLPWKPRYGAPDTPWPPRGKRLTLHFKTRDRNDLQVSARYEIFDGLPLLCKQVVIKNAGTNEVKVDQLITEMLALSHDQASRLWIESDYGFHRMVTTRWEEDPLYTTFSEGREAIEDLHYVPNSTLDQPWKKADPGQYLGPGAARYLAVSKYSQGLAKTLKPGETFTSFRTYEMLQDNDDAERQGLLRRKMFRTVAPWTQENPIFMHLRNSDSASIRRAVDQCAETGFEMIILTFWSGFNMESTDRKYWERLKGDFDYAHSRGIRIGGYILFCSTASKGPNDDAKQDVYPPSLCLGSAYVDSYFKHLFEFMEFVGQDVIETDGPYHGYPCEATNHKYHQGRDDSFRVQWEKMTEFFHGCRQRGIFVNAPDSYFHHGSSKTGMGYREENWSLPREYQVLIGRQNIYDGTWRKLSSMGWMMTPLVEYHGGGPGATLEPLKNHLEAYGAHLAQNFGSGVQSCYRGPRLYDAEETRALVKGTVDWYKKYRAILDSEIIHVRRPDGRDVDCMLHANPALKEKGLAMMYNPLSQPVNRTIQLPLYYTGLSDIARIREKEGGPRTFQLDREFNANVPVTVPARGHTWLVIE
jgi:hypothetical protein